MTRADWDNGRLARCDVFNAETQGRREEAQGDGKAGRLDPQFAQTGTTGILPVGMNEPHHSLIFSRGGRGGDEGLARTRGGEVGSPLTLRQLNGILCAEK